MRMTIMMASIARRVATSSLCGLSTSTTSTSPTSTSTSNKNGKTIDKKRFGGGHNKHNHRHDNGKKQQQPIISTTSTSSSGGLSSFSSSGGGGGDGIDDGPSSTSTSSSSNQTTTMITSNSQSSPKSSSSITSTNRSEKVKFGVPFVDVCSLHNDLPSLLIMMILKMNKEAPYKKDVFRAPGNQANMKKLIQFLQNGRLINLEQFSVHTIASVLKKFLRKLPDGIFGQKNEQLLFEIFGNLAIKTTNNDYSEEKILQIQRILFSLPIVTQHLLVLLFGTFRSISDSLQSSMTSESISISVAPSFFHSCISDGNKFAKIEDVQRFKIASSIMKFLIDNFGINNLFGKDNYDYYCRMTGKIVNVEENWTFTYHYPSKNLVPNMKSIPECNSSPMCSTNFQHHTNSIMMDSSNIIGNESIRSHSVENDDPHMMIISMEDNRVKFYNNNRLTNSESSPNDTTMMMMINNNGNQPKQMDNLKNVNQYAESTKSLTFLPIVHERQTQRMKTRSEWFLKSRGENSGGGGLGNHSNNSSFRSQNLLSSSTIPTSLSSSSTSSATTTTTTKGLIKKTSSKEKRDKVLLRRTSSKKSEKPCFNNNNNNLSNESTAINNSQKSTQDVSKNSNNKFSSIMMKKINDHDCTERSIRQTTIKYSYKPTKM
ncbi:uncharacterized protein LOC113798308 isoform X2 [Dermatophagoides pteronyssinus]|uniref:uncharacterized protein LOC113798308 isoform X2 n=1 Tax=Dermatophagoides pteronyssinus TaxID=6956 RepID=UPI003F672201